MMLCNATHARTHTVHSAHQLLTNQHPHRYFGLEELVTPMHCRINPSYFKCKGGTGRFLYYDDVYVTDAAAISARARGKGRGKGGVGRGNGDSCLTALIKLLRGVVLSITQGSISTLINEMEGRRTCGGRRDRDGERKRKKKWERGRGRGRDSEVQTHTRTRTNRHVHTRARAHTHTRTRTHIHARTHTHTQPRA